MNCKLQTRLPTAYHLPKVLRIKKGCKELLKTPGIGRKSVPLKQIKGKEKLVVSRVILKGFDKWQLPKDGIYYLFLAWANWLLCQHPCTDRFSDIILIYIRRVISSFSPSPPHSSPPLTSIKLYLHSGFLPHLSHFSLLSPSPSHNLCVFSLLAIIFLLSSFGRAVPGILPSSRTRSQLSKTIRQLFESLCLHHCREVKKREGSKVTFKGCAIQNVKSNNHIWLQFWYFSPCTFSEVLSSSSGSLCLIEYFLLVHPSCIRKKDTERYLLPLAPSHFLLLFLPLLNCSLIWCSSPLTYPCYCLSVAAQLPSITLRSLQFLSFVSFSTTSPVGSQ